MNERWTAGMDAISAYPADLGQPSKLAANAAYGKGARIMGLTVVVADKPKQGVIQGTIPPELAELLGAEVPKAMADPLNKEILIQADTEKEAKLMGQYAKAWAPRQDPPLFMRLIANRRDMDEKTVRLTVCLLENAPKLGRSPGKAE
jgi:hypothetical protein